MGRKDNISPLFMKMIVICFVLVELEQLLILLCHVKHIKLGQCLQIRVANQNEISVAVAFMFSFLYKTHHEKPSISQDCGSFNSGNNSNPIGSDKSTKFIFMFKVSTYLS